MKIECIDDKNEVMYGFTYPESLNEDALIKETLKSLDGWYTKTKATICDWFECSCDPL